MALARLQSIQPEQALGRIRELLATVERTIVFTIEAWDINCPQHIHKRFAQRQVAPVIPDLQARLAEADPAARRPTRGSHFHVP